MKAKWVTVSLIGVLSTFILLLLSATLSVAFNSTGWLPDSVVRFLTSDLGDGVGPGPVGPKGEKGEPGEPGTIGPVGPEGEAGAIGPVGPVGPSGTDGSQGPQGEMGPQGDTGPQGETGPQGDTGAAGAQGIPGPVGPVGPQGEQGLPGGFGAYGSFYDTTTVPLSQNVASPVPLNTTDFASGISVVDDSKISFAVTGKFNISFSSQIEKADAGTDVVSVWLRKNNNNVPWTNTDVIVTASRENSRHLVALNFFVDAAIGDYYELMMTSTTSNQTVIKSVGAQTNPDRPEIPGTILTVNQVG